MGLGWVFLIRGDAAWIVLDYLAGLYRIGCIILYRLDCIREHSLLCAGWLMAGWTGWDIWNGWDIGGTGVRWIDQRYQASEWERYHWLRNGSAIIGS